MPPFAARKMVARLQAATASGRPVILRTTRRAAIPPTTVKPFSRRVQTAAAELAFLMRELGLPLPAAAKSK